MDTDFVQVLLERAAGAAGSAPAEAAANEGAQGFTLDHGLLIAAVVLVVVGLLLLLVFLRRSRKPSDQ